MTITSLKHHAPESIRNEALAALRYYPSLVTTPIEFKFKRRLRKSIMKAQPLWKSIFMSRKKRAYVILVSESFKIGDELFMTKNLASDILIGWFGHELGHIKDYQQRNGFNLLGFGLRYLLSKKFIRHAEQTADSFAVSRGMASYILSAKEFILHQASIDDKYRSRIKELYLSPDEILLLAKELEEES